LEVDFQQGNFKILWLLPQVLILFLVKKWIPPTRSETEKLVKKTEGILGVKIYIDSYISFERFVQYRFSKLLSTNVRFLKRRKYVSPQKLTFLIENMTLQK
jgi:hypothetical protein